MELIVRSYSLTLQRATAKMIEVRENHASPHEHRLLLFWSAIQTPVKPHSLMPFTCTYCQFELAHLMATLPFPHGSLSTSLWKVFTFFVFNIL